MDNWTAQWGWAYRENYCAKYLSAYRYKALRWWNLRRTGRFLLLYDVMSKPIRSYWKEGESPLAGTGVECTNIFKFWGASNVWDLNHKAVECRNETACAKCAGSYELIHCDSDIEKCANCLVVNKKLIRI
jgi:hypothetical protein